MKDLIVFLAKALVDKPDVVELTVTPAADHSLYELKVGTTGSASESDPAP